MNQILKNLITDVAGLMVGNAADPRVEVGRHGGPLRGAGGRLCPRHGRARRARGRPTCSRPSRPWRRSTRWCWPGGSAFGLDAAGAVMTALAAPAAASPSAMRGCRWCRRRSCSTSPMAATRTGARRRPMRRLGADGLRRGRSPTSPSARPAPGPARPRSTSRAGSARPRCASPTARPSARWSRSTPSARRRSATAAHFWAAPFEVGGRVRRPRLARRPDPRGARALRHKGAGAAGREHHHRRRRHRRDADQGRGQAARDHGP